MTILETRYYNSGAFSSDLRKKCMIQPEPVVEHPLESALAVGSVDPKHFEAPAKRIDSVINLGGSGDDYVPNTELPCSFKDTPQVMGERRKFIASVLKIGNSEAFPGASLIDPATGNRIQELPCGVLRQPGSPRRAQSSPAQPVDRKKPIASASSVSEMILKAVLSESEADIPEQIPALPEEEKKMEEPASSKPDEPKEENEMDEDLFGSTVEPKKRKQPEEKKEESSSSSSEEQPYSFASRREKKKQSESSGSSSSSSDESEQAPKRVKRKTAPVKRFYDEALEGLEETADHKLVKKGTAKATPEAAKPKPVAKVQQPKGPAVVKRAVVKVAEVNNSLYNMRIFYENSDCDQPLFINFEGIEKIAIAEAASKRLPNDYPINRELVDKFQQDLFDAIGQRFLFVDEEAPDYVKLFTERYNSMQNPDGSPNEKNIHWVLIFVCWNYADMRLMTDKNGSDRVVALFSKSALRDFEGCTPRLEIRQEAVMQLCWMRNACWPFRMLQLRSRETVAEHSKHNPRIKGVKEQVARLFSDESKHRTATLFVLWINFCELVGLKSVIEVCRPDL